MNLRQIGLTLVLMVSLTSCFWRTEKGPAEPVSSDKTPRQTMTKLTTTAEIVKKDRTLEIFAKIFEQADAIHREAWWVLTNERRPVGKSPFGKVQRAILSSENVKLSNKSAFRCDRYVMKRDILGVGGFPQRFEIFEKCEEKVAAKKIAQFHATSKFDIQATFFPDNLEEILGLGAAVLNRSIQCTLKENENEQLEHLKCIDWAQDRNREQMIRLDDYEYTRTGKNLIKLRGKVYENLTDTRKIEADVPMEGKILVKETELYPPEATPAPKPSPAPPPKVAATPVGGEAVPHLPSPLQQPPGPTQVTPLVGPEGVLIPPPRGAAPAVDPDVLMMQQQQQHMQQQGMPEGEHIENGEVVPPQPGAAEGAEQPQPTEYEQQLMQQQQQEQMQQEDPQQQQPQAVPEQQAPAGGVYGR